MERHRTGRVGWLRSAVLGANEASSRRPVWCSEWRRLTRASIRNWRRFAWLGLDRTLAKQVARQLMAHDALGTHARDELGISAAFRARPIQAAIASAASFLAGAALPLLVTALSPEAA